MAENATFSLHEQQLLLQLPGVGPGVIARLAQMGYPSLQQLAQAQVAEVLEKGAILTQSRCWQNSPQARRAITAAIALARQHFPDSLCLP